MMTRDEMDAVLDAHFRAEAAKDLDAVLATLTEDAEHDAVGFPVAMLTDHKSIRERYAELFEGLVDDTVEPVRRYHGDGFIVDECVITGRVDGAMLGIPGEGRTVSFRLLHVCEFRDGKMSRENVWMDAIAILAQLGAFPAAA